MESILFANWIGENHYRLVNRIGKIYYWLSESDDDGEQTTTQLYDKFKLLVKI